MRKILFSLLLATTATTPAFAQNFGHGDRTDARQEREADHSQARHDRSEARQARSEARQERSQAQDSRAEARQDRAEARQDRVEVRQQRVEMRQQRMDVRPEGMQRGDASHGGMLHERMQRSEAPVREVVRQREVRETGPKMIVNERGRPTLEQRQDAGDGVANWRRVPSDTRQQRLDQRAERNRIRAPVGARPDRPAPPPETASRRDSDRHSHWRTDWRHDHRYDWRNYRHHHRSIFRLGIYFDPFGWGYHRYGIGWRLWPSYYSSNYWLNDPYMYRLPYAPWPYKWVRYYDDALLVDMYTGQVVDVLYDFFW